MSSCTHLTAASLRAMLAFCDPENTPKIAYNRDDLALPLIEKLKEAVGNLDGSQRVSIWFQDDEQELKEQFNGVAGLIRQVFECVESMTRTDG